MSQIGWNILRVETNSDYSNEDQSYGAGLLEGYLTENEIWIHSQNIYGEKKPSKFVGIDFTSHSQIQSILDENMEWEKEESKRGDEKYWRHRKYLACTDCP